MKPAVAWSYEVAGLAILSWRQQPDLIELLTVGVVRMRVRRHVVAAAVVVDEEHARPR